MNEFNILVLNIAVIVFIITLVVVSIMLYTSIRNSNFPPFDTQCPTYFRLDASGNYPMCRFDDHSFPVDPNHRNPYNYPNQARVPSVAGCNPVLVSRFYPPGATRDEILCLKSRYAQECGVFWDGVSNNPTACLKSRGILPDGLLPGFFSRFF